MVVDAESTELRECLERELAVPLLKTGARVLRIRPEPTPFASSHRAEVVVVELTSGENLRVFLKDFGETAFDKDAARDRRERELHVYRDLLANMGLGTPHFYGSLWDERSDRFWLLLEYVDGVEMRYCHANAWISAARWVGRLHATRRWLDRLQDSPLLIRHDEAYFRRRAELALDDVAAFSSALHERLRRVVGSYRPVVEALLSQPVSLVHGGYLPANVLVANAAGTGRVCPIDWELAAIGSPLYDLATLVDGFAPPELDLLLGAYMGEALGNGAFVPEHEELKQLVQCFRLARVIRMLARARRSGYGEDRVAELVTRAEKLHEELVGHRLGTGNERYAVHGDSWLDGRIRQALDARSVRVLSHEQLKENVHRLRAEVDGVRRSLIAKRSQPEVVRRNWLVARRWLPAADLDGFGPPLLGVAAGQDGEAAWHVYEQVCGQPLSPAHASEPDIAAVLEAIARVHVGLAEHPLLRECRLWGGDRGIAFYSGNVRDAISALRAFEPPTDSPDCRDALLERMDRLRAEEGWRRESLSAYGGPETLLHGDLWTTNAIVTRRGGGVAVRLIDWDEAAAGPVAFDLSTFVLEFDRYRRPAVLGAYRQMVRRLAGWELPADCDLEAAFATVAYARLASLLVWTLAAAEGANAGWLAGRLADIMDWLDAVEPVIGGR